MDSLELKKFITDTEGRMIAKEMRSDWIEFARRWRKKLTTGLLPV